MYQKEHQMSIAMHYIILNGQRKSLEDEILVVYQILLTNNLFSGTRTQFLASLWDDSG